MKKNISWGGQYFLIVLAVVVTCMASCSSESDSALAELDKVMENKEAYIHDFVKKMNSVRTMYDLSESDAQKWVYADNLFKEYIHFSLDSAYVYLSLMKKHSQTPEDHARTAMAEVNILHQKQMHELAVKTFKDIDTVLAYTSALRKEYLTCALYLYKNLDLEELERYRQEYMALDTLSVFGQKIHSQYLRDKGYYERSLEILLSCEGTEENFHDKTSTAYNIAML